MNTKELADALAQLTDTELCQVGRELSRNGSFGRVAGLIATWQYPPPDEVWRRFVVNVERPASKDGATDAQSFLTANRQYFKRQDD